MRVRVLSTIAVAVVLIGIGPVPVFAAENPAVGGNGSTVTVDPMLKGTTINRADIPKAEPVTSSSLKSALAVQGITGNVTAQRSASGVGTFYQGDNKWLLDLSPATQARAAAAAGFSFGFCTGSFLTPRKVANYLEWGGQSSCNASDNQYYLHQVKAALYDTCVGPVCAILTYRFTATSPSSSNFGRVATAVGGANCVTVNGRTFEQKVTVKVRSVSYGPFWERGVVVNTCSVAP